MTIRFTPQGCRVETTCIIQPNGAWREEIVLSVDPASQLAIETEENAGRTIGTRVTEGKVMRVRATRHGFEPVQR